MRADCIKLEVPEAGETGTAMNVEALADPSANFVQTVITDQESGSLSVEFSFDGDTWYEFADMDAITTSDLWKTKDALNNIAPRFVRVKATSDFVAAAATVHYCGTNMQVN